MLKRITAIVLLLSMVLCSGLSGTVGAEASDTVLIHKAEDLLLIADAPEKSYKLAADIDLGEIDWVPPVLTGKFDGDGHTIYNLTVSKTGDAVRTTVDGNHKEYDTVMAGLFSAAEGATISNVSIIGANINVRPDQDANCFAAIVAGYSWDTVITNCTVQGKVYLYNSGKMCGVGGVAGFGNGTVENCDVDVELVFVDENSDVKCEEFMGGIMACGYPNIYNCNVRIDGYASVIGYVHNGGMIGMHHIHTFGSERVTYVKDSTIEGMITFFENNRDRRAYCANFIGERLHMEVRFGGCVDKNFVSNEVFKYDKILYPEKCESPNYVDEVTENSCEKLGYTVHTCSGCGYSFTDSYRLPQHTPDEWIVTSEATTQAAGHRERYCFDCGALVDSEDLPILNGVETCVLARTSLWLTYKETYALSYTLYPKDADVNDVFFVSSDSEIVKVDNSGNITAVGRGTATITCTTEDGRIYETCEVEVRYSFVQWLIVVLLFGWIWY